MCVCGWMWATRSTVVLFCGFRYWHGLCAVCNPVLSLFSVSWLYHICIMRPTFGYFYQQIYRLTFTLTTKLHKITFKSFGISAVLFCQSVFIRSFDCWFLFLWSDKFSPEFQIVISKLNSWHANRVFSIERKINRMFFFQWINTKSVWKVSKGSRFNW